MNQFFQQSLHPFSSVSTNVICMFFAQTAASLLPGCALSSSEKQKSEQFFRGASVHVTAKRWATKTGTDSASVVLFVFACCFVWCPCPVRDRPCRSVAASGTDCDRGRKSRSWASWMQIQTGSLCQNTFTPCTHEKHSGCVFDLICIT